MLTIALFMSWKHLVKLTQVVYSKKCGAHVIQEEVEKEQKLRAGGDGALVQKSQPILTHNGRPRVVVVGGGFAGVQTARSLRKANVDVVLIDRRNYHLFQPLLYQVAAAGLNPADIAQPIRRILRDQKNATVLMAHVKTVDLAKQKIILEDSEMDYSYLVLAAGGVTSYFGNDGWEENAPGLKNLEDALTIRRKVFAAFEAAELEVDEEARLAKLTFVVVGGGPTGVEMAGALKEIAVDSIPCDFRKINTTAARIVLIEGSDRLLPSMNEYSSKRAYDDLSKMGVEIRLNTFVTGVDERGVTIGDETIKADNVIWGAGVCASPIKFVNEVGKDNRGRLKVNADCSIPNHPHVFVIGDMAQQNCSKSGKEVPGVAQGALQMGSYVAKLIAKESKAFEQGKAFNRADLKPFSYWDKGSMATIGTAKAVVDSGKRSFGGLFAWLAWWVVHIAFLSGMRSKSFVMLGWISSYFLRGKGARLITHSKGLEIKKSVCFPELKSSSE